MCMNDYENDLQSAVRYLSGLTTLSHIATVFFSLSVTLFLYEPVNSELRLAVLNFLRIFSLNCS